MEFFEILKMKKEKLFAQKLQNVRQIKATNNQDWFIKLTNYGFL